MRRVARTIRLVVAAAVAAGALIATASPGLACSCVASTAAEKLETAEAAFVGRVVESSTDAEGTTQVFEVDGVYKGALGPTVEVWAQIGTGVMSSCAVVFPEGDRVALVISRSGGRWTTDGCSLVTEAQLTRLAGSPSPPTGTTAPPPSSPTPVVTTASDGRAVPRWSLPILGVLLAIAVIWLTLVLASRRGRRPGVVPGADGDATQPPPAGGGDPAGEDVDA